MKQLINRLEDTYIKRDAALINQLLLAITAGFISRSIPTYSRFALLDKALSISISYLGLYPDSPIGIKCAMSSWWSQKSMSNYCTKLRARFLNEAGDSLAQMYLREMTKKLFLVEKE